MALNCTKWPYCNELVLYFWLYKKDERSRREMIFFWWSCLQTEEKNVLRNVFRAIMVYILWELVWWFSLCSECSYSRVRELFYSGDDKTRKIVALLRHNRITLKENELVRDSTQFVSWQNYFCVFVFDFLPK